MVQWTAYTHGSKDDSKVVRVVIKNSFAGQLNKTTLSTDLSRNLQQNTNVTTVSLLGRIAVLGT